MQLKKRVAHELFLVWVPCYLGSGGNDGKKFVLQSSRSVVRKKRQITLQQKGLSWSKSWKGKRGWWSEDWGTDGESRSSK